MQGCPFATRRQVSTQEPRTPVCVCVCACVCHGQRTPPAPSPHVAATVSTVMVRGSPGVSGRTAGAKPWGCEGGNLLEHHPVNPPPPGL